MTTYTFPADQIRVEVERDPSQVYNAGTPDEYVAPDAIIVSVFRGDTSVEKSNIDRGELFDVGDFDHELTPNEVQHLNAVLLVEWAQWPEVGDTKPLDLYTELCRLCRELEPKEQES